MVRTDWVRGLFFSNRRPITGERAVNRVSLFKMVVLQHLHNRSDKQAEYHVQERLGFQRFLGQGLKEAVPDRGETRAALLWYLCRDDWKGNAL
ncbi:MAG: transposase [Acidithiobacillus ferriphilus]